MKYYIKLLFVIIFVILGYGSELFVKTTFAQTCGGRSSAVLTCKVTNGNCVGATWEYYGCSALNGTCQGYVANRICGFVKQGDGSFVCKTIEGSPPAVYIPCETVTATPTPIGGGGGGPTPTTAVCTTTCVDTEECKRADGCTTGIQGAYCGQTSTDNTPKYMCRTSSCTTVCPPTSTVTPTPIIPGIPTTITPSGTLACPLGPTTPVVFSWTAVPNATSYYVRIDDTSNPWAANCGVGTPNNGDICSGNITGTSFTATLSANKSYQWFVSAYAGTVQGAASAWVPFSIPNICATPTPVQSAMCQNILAYSSNWSLLTNAQLTQTKAGDVLNYCVTGFTNAGTFDMARFTINGVLNPNTTLLRPGTTADYCQTYTVPTNTYNFNIVGEIHNTILGWVQ